MSPVQARVHVWVRHFVLGRRFRRFRRCRLDGLLGNLEMTRNGGRALGHSNMAAAGCSGNTCILNVVSARLQYSQAQGCRTCGVAASSVDERPADMVFIFFASMGSIFSPMICLALLEAHTRIAARTLSLVSCLRCGGWCSRDTITKRTVDS